MPAAGVLPPGPFGIDAYSLDLEWLGHSDRVGDVARRLAAARKARAEAESNVKATAARVAADVRARPGAYGLDAKPNKDAVDGAVQGAAMYRNASDALIEASYDVDVLTGDLDTLKERRRAIEGMQQLFLACYYGDPDAVDAMQKRFTYQRAQRRANGDE